MSDIRWNEEPDLAEFRRLHALLAANAETALIGPRSLADRGSIGGMICIGDVYRGGKGVLKDLNLAKYWYEPAEKGGSVYAGYLLGHVLQQIGENDAAFAAYSRGAKKQYLPAIYRLAKMYQFGLGTAKDMRARRNLLESATSKGHFFAKRDLGTLFIRGEFGPALMIRGSLMLMSLFLDLTAEVARAVRRGPIIHERLLG